MRRSASTPPISRDLRPAADRRRVSIDQRLDRPAHQDLHRARSKSEFEAGSELSAQQGGLVRRPLERAQAAGRAGARAPQYRDGGRRRRAAPRRRSADHRPRGREGPQDAAARARRQEGDVRDAARASTGRRPRRWRSAPCSPRAMAVRLSGQDSGRGTFSQRHAVLGRPGERREIHPALPRRAAAASRSATPRCPNSACSASNMAIRSPTRARSCCWEAQFGDFANGAQTIIDQFIASGEAKWLRASGLVMLLPHGFEGQGPEHSSARLERYLQLCAEDNLQVANCTTPANYFHILRRQMLRDFRKPLIMMTPKSLLRHKLAVSKIEDFIGDSHFRRIVSDLRPPQEGETKRLVLCTGKLAYELMDARDAAGDRDDRDHPDRAALSVPVGAPGQAAAGHAEARGPGLVAGRAEEQRRLVLRRGPAGAVPRRGRLQGHAAASMRAASPRLRPQPASPSAMPPSRRT